VRIPETITPKTSASAQTHALKERDRIAIAVPEHHEAEGDFPRTASQRALQWISKSRAART
jgi:hypothetical protein